MTLLIGIICIVLLIIVIVQIGKVTELANRIRGEEDVQADSDYWNSRLGVVFMILFLVGSIWSAMYYKNYMLGFGPHESASAHGGSLDSMFAITLFFTGIVFVVTQIALFWFSYKYRYNKNRKALFAPHDNRLEIIWTAIPAVVMAILVVYGLEAWNTVMADVSPEEEYIEVEATGLQFAWILRYAGEDGELGSRDYRRINGLNPLGQIWEDKANLDDIQPNDLVLPVGKKVRVKITSRDVLHNFYLPHFRLKMDAVPGMPTYFVFTPTKTTVEYRKELSKYKEYQVPVDPTDPESPMKWEVFDYELACAELCGKGHFSMRKTVKIVTEEEYEEWLSEQSSYYLSNVRNSDDDPYKDELLGIELENQLSETLTELEVLSSISNSDMDASVDQNESISEDSMNEGESEELASENDGNDMVDGAESGSEDEDGKKNAGIEEQVVEIPVHYFFKGKKTKVAPKAKEYLDNIVGLLNNSPMAKVQLTHDEGDAELLNDRKLAIKNYFLSKNIAADRIVNQLQEK